MPSEPSDPDDVLLTPREVAAVVGVTVTTVSRWARAEALKPSALTPGGQRRYRRGDVIAFRANRPKMDPEHQQMEKDAVRLYEQGWSIRQVAARFDYNYGSMRRLLIKNTTLRK
ncbi:MAG: helix-turn-helix domain-containing protein [Actinoallomurus sp.]